MPSEMCIRDRTKQEREHGHKQGQHQHKGSGKNFEYDPHRGFLLFPVYVYYNSEKIGTQGDVYKRQAIILEVSKYPAISCCFSYRDRIVMPGDEAVMD